MLTRAAILAFGVIATFVVVPCQVHAGDFDGDGRDDLAVGAPFNELPDRISSTGEGSVNVLYGALPRLTVAGNQFITEAAPWFPGNGPAHLVAFGGTLAGGDFDRDGHDELVVGVDREQVTTTSGKVDAGAVFLVRGGKSGLTRQVTAITEATPGIRGVPEEADSFGLSLASGDFDGDGHRDLAIGNSTQTVAGIQGAGIVHVIYGGRRGLRPSTDELFSQRTPGISGDGEEEGDSFGFSLVAADFDDDGRDDLAIGSRYEGIGKTGFVGSVDALYGSPKGINARRAQRFDPGSRGLEFPKPPQIDAQFGFALAAGDLNGDDRADLAIGVPGQTPPGPSPPRGAIEVLFGSQGGLTKKGDEYLAGADSRLPGEFNQGFGRSLTAGDLNADRHADLVIGSPFAADGEAGSVHVLFGSRRGVLPLRDRYLNQETPGMAGNGTVYFDHFGASITTGDLNGRGPDELVIGEPEGFNEDTGQCYGGGAIHILYPDRNWYLLRREDQFITQQEPGLLGDGLSLCGQFGGSLVAPGP